MVKWSHHLFCVEYVILEFGVVLIFCQCTPFRSPYVKYASKAVYEWLSALLKFV